LARALEEKSEDTEWLFLKLHRDAMAFQNACIEVRFVQAETANTVLGGGRVHRNKVQASYFRQYGLVESFIQPLYLP
jgi:hypothetical protein